MVKDSKRAKKAVEPDALVVQDVPADNEVQSELHMQKTMHLVKYANNAIRHIKCRQEAALRDLIMELCAIMYEGAWLFNVSDIAEYLKLLGHAEGEIIASDCIAVRDNIAKMKLNSND